MISNLQLFALALGKAALLTAIGPGVAIAIFYEAYFVRRRSRGATGERKRQRIFNPSGNVTERRTVGQAAIRPALQPSSNSGRFATPTDGLMPTHVNRASCPPRKARRA